MVCCNDEDSCVALNHLPAYPLSLSLVPVGSASPPPPPSPTAEVPLRTRSPFLLHFLHFHFFFFLHFHYLLYSAKCCIHGCGSDRLATKWRQDLFLFHSNNCLPSVRELLTKNETTLRKMCENLRGGEYSIGSVRFKGL